MSPEEHDKINAGIGIGYFIALVLDKELTDDEKSILSEVSSGKKLITLLEQVTSNRPSTYRETQGDNPFMDKNRKRISRALEIYHERLTQVL